MNDATLDVIRPFNADVPYADDLQLPTPAQCYEGRTGFRVTRMTIERSQTDLLSNPLRNLRAELSPRRRRACPTGVQHDP
jgi:hypothetical protein